MAYWYGACVYCVLLLLTTIVSYLLEVLPHMVQLSPISGVSLAVDSVVFSLSAKWRCCSLRPIGMIHVYTVY